MIDTEKIRKYDNFKRRLPPNYQGKTFDNFIVPAGSQLEKFKNKLMTEWNGEPIALLSKLTGVGKTHLACACLFQYQKLLIDAWIEKNKNVEFKPRHYADFDTTTEAAFSGHMAVYAPTFVNESKIYYEITATYKTDNYDTEERIINEYSKMKGLLIIDDLFASRQTEFARGKIYDILNNRIEYSSLPTIITSNFTLAEIGSQIDDRIASRLQGKFCFEITEGKDYRSL